MKLLSLKAAVSTNYFFPFREYLVDLETEQPKAKGEKVDFMASLLHEAFVSLLLLYYVQLANCKKM